MGARGPVPNRSEDLARPRERRGGENNEVTRGTLREVTPLAPDENWHYIAQLLWDGLASSGQSDFYQDSDWAFAYSLCDDLSFYKRNEYKRSGQMLQTIYSAMERLLVTEGDRRRVRIELTAPEPEEDAATVAVMDDYRKGLRLVPTEGDDNSEG